MNKMTDENSLAEQVKTLQRHMGLFGKAFKDLTERVKALEEKEKSDDNKEIREIIETQRVIDEIIVANTDTIKKLNSEMAELQNYQAIGNKEVVEMPAKQSVTNGKRKRCRYYNKGHCKYKEKCRFYHPKNVCKAYLDCGKCEQKDCSERHPKVCKFWSQNKNGCGRNLDCDFLHVTIVQNDQNVEVERKVKDTEYKCASCKDSWTSKNCVVEHNLNNHVLYFCLNCNDWVTDKSKVLDTNWTLLDERGYLRRNL